LLIPSETQYLCSNYLESMYLDREHQFQSSWIRTLFQSFYSLEPLAGNNEKAITSPTIEYNQTNDLLSKFPDKVIGYLTLITVQHILPIWNRKPQEIPFENIVSPQHILDVIEGILKGKIPLTNALYKYSEEFNLGLNIKSWVTYSVYCVYEAAYLALELVLDGFTLKDTVLFLDTSSIWYNDNFLSAAVKAYSVLDTNKGGAWEFVEQLSLPINFDLQKRLEFWEWWLTEAIPQAWELALETAL